MKKSFCSSGFSLGIFLQKEFFSFNICAHWSPPASAGGGKCGLVLKYSLLQNRFRALLKARYCFASTSAKHRRGQVSRPIAVPRRTRHIVERLELQAQTFAFRREWLICYSYILFCFICLIYKHLHFFGYFCHNPKKSKERGSIKVEKFYRLILTFF